MTLLILGGGALGLQACRLARAAGIRSVVADRDGDCPAAALADGFVRMDVRAGPLPEAGFILPATENDAVLEGLTGKNVLFDPAAWHLTSSRLASDAFLRELKIPVPAYFPGGSEPYIVKPDRGSFGRGIWVTEDFCEVGGAVNGGFVAQEELDGPVWSAAVLRKDGRCASYPPAMLAFDSRRRRLSARCLPAPDGAALERTARKIAQAMELDGLLEVEAIFHQGLWKVIDLNARLPLFTPDALLAEGVNLLESLCGA